MTVVTEWDVSTRDGFLECYRATVRDVYGYAGMLAGPDRAAAEAIVRAAYLDLERSALVGEVRTVGYGVLRRAVRHGWMDHWSAQRREGAPAAALTEPVQRLADVPTPERTLVVLHHVDGMPLDRIADMLGTNAEVVGRVLARAHRRLGREERADG